MQDDLQDNLQGNLQAKSSLQNGAQIDTAKDEQIFSAQLTHFFENWQQIHSTPTQGEDLAEQLQSFFDGWAKLPTIEEKQPKQIKSLDQKEVAENYVSDTLEDALTPITEALEIVQKAHPIFKKIVQEAIDRFGRYVDERETDDTPDTIANDANVATPSTAE